MTIPNSTRSANSGPPFHIAHFGLSGPQRYGENHGARTVVKNTFPDVISRHNDDGIYTPEKLQKLKFVFDRVCKEASIRPNDKRLRAKLATIVLVGSKLYNDEDEFMKAAIKALALPSAG